MRIGLPPRLAFIETKAVLMLGVNGYLLFQLILQVVIYMHKIYM